jgi:hypothetical protein
MPLLYGLDRGNLILLALACVVLAFGPLVRSARLRWIALAVAINLKVYIVTALAAQLLRRRWRWTEGAALATVVVYLLSYAALGAGTPMELVTNIRDFAKADVVGNVLDVWYPATYLPMIKLLTGSDFPVIVLLGSRVMDWGGAILPILMHLGQATIAMGAVAIWLRPRVVPPYRATMLALSMALITSEAGAIRPASSCSS